MAEKKRASKASGASVPQADICFTIMPFGGWLDDYYEAIYCRAIRAAGLEPHRADDLFRPSMIINDIWAYTRRARLLLADLTGKNPNVFYELGLAHALAKPAILVAESMDDIPFDLRALRVIVYDKNAPNWGDRLAADIEASINEVLDAPLSAVLPTFLDLKADARPSVTPRDMDMLEIRQELEALRRDVQSANQPRFAQMSRTESSLLMRKMFEAGVPEDEIVVELGRRGVVASWVRSGLGMLREQEAVLNAKDVVGPATDTPV